MPVYDHDTKDFASFLSERMCGDQDKFGVRRTPRYWKDSTLSSRLLKSLERGMSLYCGSACKRKTYLHLAGLLSARSLEEIWEEIKLRSAWKRVKSGEDESGLKTNMSSAYMIRLEFGDQMLH